MGVGTGIGDDISAGDYQYDLGAHRYLGGLGSIKNNGELLAVVSVGNILYVALLVAPYLGEGCRARQTGEDKAEKQS
jgi:hypothetical protein